MKSVIICIATVALLASCVTTTKFPVSNVAPAATITVKKQKDKHDNFVITITANNLASAERLSPPKNTYVVWITTKDDGLQNMGQLAHKNA